MQTPLGPSLLPCSDLFCSAGKCLPTGQSISELILQVSQLTPGEPLPNAHNRPQGAPTSCPHNWPLGSY